MAGITHDLDHAARGVARLIDRYRKPRTSALLASWLDEVQEAEDALWQLMVERWLSTAEGEQLDVLGRIVGEPRRGRDDATYAIWISARNMVSRSSGRTEEMLAIARKLIAPEDLIALEEYFPAAMVFRLTGTFTLDMGYQIAFMLRQAKAAGVLFQMTWAVAGTSAFRFAPGDTPVAGSARGFDAGIWAVVADGSFIPSEPEGLPLGSIVIDGIPLVIDGVPLVITPPVALAPPPSMRLRPLLVPSARIVPRAAAPRALPAPLVDETIELEDAFADGSLEMDETGEQFRLALALQGDITDATAGVAAALGAAAAAQADADAAQAAADAAQADADTAQVTANTALAAAGASPPMGYLLRAPSTPAVVGWNDEFDSGSPDLVARGWTVQETVTGIVPTRAGEVDPNLTPSTGTYRSSLIGTKLVIQVSAAPIFISKPVGAGGCAIAARVNMLNQDGSGVSPWGVGISTTAAHSGSTSAARFTFGWNQANQAKLLEYVGPSTYTNRGTVNTISGIQGYDTMWTSVTVAAGNMTAAHARHIAMHGGVTVASTFSGSIAGYGVALHGGLLLPAGNLYGLFEIDFIRQYAVGSFFPP